MKKGLVILMAIAMLFAMSSLALAKQELNSDPSSTFVIGAKGNIVANTYTPVASDTANPLSVKDYRYYEQGKVVTAAGTENPFMADSTHVYGTWNSPYTMGIDGYNYNDAQDYVETGKQAAQMGDATELPINPAFLSAVQTMMAPFMPAMTAYGITMGTGAAGGKYPGQAVINTHLAGNFQSGPHGGYLTSTHRCRECHAVHRAAGKFKLLRSDTRFEACDWCHGTGAGSGYNIQMDNNDNYTTEYNVGHTMGYGIDNGKWKAPDDTYPAFTPNYYMGGFSCFDCHSPHANPARMLGYNQDGKPIQSIVDVMSGQVYNLGNPGHDMYTSGGEGFAQTVYDPTPGHEALNKFAWVPALGGPLPNKAKPYYLAGSWLLLKNPDKEISANSAGVQPVDIWTVPSANGMAPFGGAPVQDAPVTLAIGQEIPDMVTAALNEFDATKAYPVNKIPISWNTPVGSAAIIDTTQMFGFAPQSMPFGPNPTDVNPNVGLVNGKAWTSDQYGFNVRNPFCKSLIVDEFCTDCHDGNAGLSTIAAPLFSEDRALRGQTQTSGKVGSLEAPVVTGDTTNWKGSYDIAYGHDSNSRH